MIGGIHLDRAGAQKLVRGALHRCRAMGKILVLVAITLFLAALISPATGRFVWVALVALLGYAAGRIHASMLLNRRSQPRRGQASKPGG
jgi:hypothetical protein